MSNKEAASKMVVRPTASLTASRSAQFCAGCGAKISGEASSCWRCGRFFQSRESGTWSVQNSYYRLPAMRAYRSAAPAKRILAALFDSVIILGIIAVTELLAHIFLHYGIASQFQVFESIIAVCAFVPIVYLLVFDSTCLQGSPGKAVYELKVTDLSDRNADFSATFRRAVSKIVFLVPTLAVLGVIINTGIALNSFAFFSLLVLLPLCLYSLDVAIAFTMEENRTLVDRLSGTMVVRR